MPPSRRLPIHRPTGDRKHDRKSCTLATLSRLGYESGRDHHHRFREGEGPEVKAEHLPPPLVMRVCARRACTRGDECKRFEKRTQHTKRENALFNTRKPLTLPPFPPGSRQPPASRRAVPRYTFYGRLKETEGKKGGRKEEEEEEVASEKYPDHPRTHCAIPSVLHEYPASSISCPADGRSYRNCFFDSMANISWKGAKKKRKKKKNGYSNTYNVTCIRTPRHTHTYIHTHVHIHN